MLLHNFTTWTSDTPITKCITYLDMHAYLVHGSVMQSYIFYKSNSTTLPFTPGGVLHLSLVRGVLPGPWNLDPVYDKMFGKSWKTDTLFMSFQVKFHSFFCQNAWFLDPVYKKSSKIFQFETLFMSRWSKNHTLKGCTSLYSLSMGVPPPRGFYQTFTALCVT